MTKAYNSLVRVVKKNAPYTEITEKRVVGNDEFYPTEHEYKYKIYITKECLYLKNQGFKLG